MSVPRGLTAEEAAAWARLAQSVTPLEGKSAPKPAVVKPHVAGHAELLEAAAHRVPLKRPRIAPVAGRQAAPPKPLSSHAGLDSHWERKFKGGGVQPDVTLDLHDHSLDAAYHRLMAGLDQARAIDARVLLLITGRPRPVDPADRAVRRGAIRAKVLDWIAASHHEGSIAAVRKAHQRHGGEGALYLVMKRAR
ncbi:Smr/MutS family protein [Altererythrobacter sp. GH1-8]|uniref:Smr/MutS family protein n=1 Tax=Altererythrobacter sp. GH1-8 TaxID=3349333 RepID=UPI00374DC500